MKIKYVCFLDTTLDIEAAINMSWIKSQESKSLPLALHGSERVTHLSLIPTEFFSSKNLTYYMIQNKIFQLF